MEVFNKQSYVLVRQLEKQLGNEDGFDCTIYATLTSLDIICGKCVLQCVTKHTTPLTCSQFPIHRNGHGLPDKRAGKIRLGVREGP